MVWLHFLTTYGFWTPPILLPILPHIWMSEESMDIPSFGTTGKHTPHKLQLTNRTLARPYPKDTKQTKPVFFPVLSYHYLTCLGGYLALLRKFNFYVISLQWHPTPVLLPGKSHGLRSLVGCSPWGRKESDTTERLHFHFSLSCTGEGNGSPLQCSCLENPRDGGAWWAAVCGVAQSRTWLTQLSSSIPS